MLLELIFNDLLNNIPHGRTHARMDKIPSSRAPVGAKNALSSNELLSLKNEEKNKRFVKYLLMDGTNKS